MSAEPAPSIASVGEEQPLLTSLFYGPTPPNPYVMQSVARLLSIVVTATVVAVVILLWRAL